MLQFYAFYAVEEVEKVSTPSNAEENNTLFDFIFYLVATRQFAWILKIIWPNVEV